MSLEPDLQCKKTVLKNVKYKRREDKGEPERVWGCHGGWRCVQRLWRTIYVHLIVALTDQWRRRREWVLYNG